MSLQNYAAIVWLAAATLTLASGSTSADPLATPSSERLLLVKGKFRDPILSSELRIAVAADSMLVGRSNQGDVILDVGSQPRAQVWQRLASIPGLVLSDNVPRSYEKIRSILIGVPNATPFDRASLSKLARSLNANVTRFSSKLPFAELTLLPDQAGWSPELLRGLRDIAKYVEPNYRYYLINPIDFRATVDRGARRAFPNDVFISQQWGMTKITMPGVWPTHTSASRVVAVIDTGIDRRHADISANIWENTDEIPDNNIDDDNNGYVDDVFGYNFVNRSPDTLDAGGHGTHCAGDIAAIGNNAFGIAGVNWTIKIMPIRIFGPGNTSANAADIAEAVLYAVDNGATVLNNSWGGGPFSQALSDAIDYCNASNVLFIAAAGNGRTNINDCPFYPASYPHDNIISVLASDRFGRICPFTNFGSTAVDLGAPGSDIVSLGLSPTCAVSSGTSMAAPFVTAVAAMTWSTTEHAGKSALEIKSLIVNSVRPSTALQGLCVAGGSLDAGFLVGITPTPDCAPLSCRCECEQLKTRRIIRWRNRCTFRASQKPTPALGKRRS